MKIEPFFLLCFLTKIYGSVNELFGDGTDRRGQDTKVKGLFLSKRWFVNLDGLGWKF